MKTTRLAISLLILSATATACGELPAEDEVLLNPVEQTTAVPSTSASPSPDVEVASQELSFGFLKDLWNGVEGAGGAVWGGVRGTISPANWKTLGKLIVDVFSTAVAIPVTYQERLEICRATGGLGLTSVKVSKCVGGVQKVSPAGVRFDGSPFEWEQIQECTEGWGHDYGDPQCVYADHKGNYFFDDGPSIPAEADSFLLPRFTFDQRYARLFWPAGQLHDYCYHHTSTYGLNKKVCDADFLKSMKQICARTHQGILGVSYNREACEGSAEIMAKFVRDTVTATEAYFYTKTKVYYHGAPPPPSTPRPEYPEGTSPPAEVETCQAPMRKTDVGCVCDDQAAREACTSSVSAGGRPMEYVPSGSPDSCGSCEIAQP